MRAVPKRSNDFQRLIFLVKKHFAGGATVTESKILHEIDSDEEREVDVVIEMTVAGQPVIIGIECIDKNRRAGKEWVEQMHGKHSRLPTDQLVLASRRGFYEPAIRKAKTFNIQTLAFAEATERVVGSLFEAITELVATEVLLTPGTTHVQVMDPRGRLLEATVDASTAIVDAQLRQLNTFKVAVDGLLSSDRVGRPIVAGAPSDAKFFKIVAEYADQDFYVVDIDTGELHKIRTITVIGRLHQAAARFPMAQVQVGADQVLWGKSQFLGGDAVIVLSETAGRGRMSLQVSPLSKADSKKKP
jgi:hypothetical protein